jgi:propionyl-CoA carboxylase alpha chain
MYYDPMIAKLVTHAPTREAAIDAQSAALDAFYIDGIQHNVPFLATMMQHPRWRSGKISTAFIKEEFPEGFVPRTPEGADLVTLAAVAGAIDHLGNTRRRDITHQMAGRSISFAKRRVVKIGDTTVLLEALGVIPGPYYVSILDDAGQPAKTLEITSDWWPGEPVWQGTVDGADVAVQVRPIPNGMLLSYRGMQAPIYVYTQREAELAALMPVKVAADMSKYLLCPMPGLVKSINVVEGQDVKAGDALAVVEAMKMENILKAERDGKVKKVAAKAGESLAVDAVILEFA